MTTTTKQRLDTLAADRDTLREEKRNLEAQVKVIDEKLASNETDIIAIADEMGLDRFAVGKLTFSISSNVVGNVEDWDAVHAYIKENDAFYLLQRRLSNAPYKEILDSGESLAGVVPFTKRSLNMRKSA